MSSMPPLEDPLMFTLQMGRCTTETIVIIFQICDLQFLWGEGRSNICLRRMDTVLNIAAQHLKCQMCSNAASSELFIHCSDLMCVCVLSIERRSDIHVGTRDW